MMYKYVYILILINLSACSLINPFDDEGKYTEMVLRVDEFSKIEVLNIFNIEIIEDTESYILYKGGENILTKMTYSSTSGLLKLDHNYLNWSRNFKIPTLEIHMPLLEALDLKGSCTLKNQTQLSGKNLSIYVHDSADVYDMDLNVNYQNLRFHSRGSGGKLSVKGHCPTASYVLNGSANLDATQLISNNVSLTQNSLGNGHVYVDNKLTVLFLKSGDVYYKGEPKEINVSYKQINNQDASGKIIKE